MQLTAQEEYGLRCLVRLAMAGEDSSLTVHEIAQAEGISGPYGAKLMRILREGGLVYSERGQAGGYLLTRPPRNITVKEAVAVLGGDLFGGEFCGRFSGREDLCRHSTDCSIRSLWRTVQLVVDHVLRRTTLQDLLCTEREMDEFVAGLVELPDTVQTIVTVQDHG